MPRARRLRSGRARECVVTSASPSQVRHCPASSLRARLLRRRRFLGASKDSLKRSINLALSVRGQEALKAVGCLDEVMRGTVAMAKRAIHAHDGSLSFQPYGTRDQAIYSVSRRLLNRVLLDAIALESNVTLHFGMKLKGITADGEVTLRRLAADGSEGEPEDRSRDVVVRTKLILGADGAYSRVREALLRLMRADFSRKYIPHSYKEFDLPATESGEFALPEPGSLHIWPRHDFMFIALPNPDKSFTCTLFAPNEHFEKLDREGDAAIRSFFETEFPDATRILPDVVRQYHEHPTGALVAVRVKPWNYKSRILLVGDAAHAIVPFYGQGMNAGFEDCLVFSEVLDSLGGNLAEAVPRFAAVRSPAAEGIADLSDKNYVEMRSHTASTSFLIKKRVEAGLHWLFPAYWIPQYTMVSFTRIPYHEARDRAERQDRILDLAGKGLLASALLTAAYFGAKYYRTHF